MQNEHESTDIIRIDHLNKTFGDVKAVNDLSFRVKKGELLAFLGVNGSGKSTDKFFNSVHGVVTGYKLIL